MGDVPEELGFLVKLGKLVLESRREALAGLELISNDFSVRHFTEGLGLEDNGFEGSMPEGICQLADLNSMELWSDCGGETPEITCECCSVCCPSADCTASARRRW